MLLKSTREGQQSMHEESSKITIRPAGPQDLEEIFRIAEENSKKNIPEEKAGENGFLVSDYSKEDYADFLQRADYFFVIMVNKDIVGFMLAYSHDKIRKEEYINNLIRERSDVPFVLIKQVCIDKKNAGSGYAKNLYDYLFRHAREKKFSGAIVHKPRNTRSIEFHERLGFRLDFEATPEDGMPRGIYVKET